MPRALKRSPRTVVAPPPSPAATNLPSNRVFSVALEPDEDVEWTWTSTVDSVSYVSGYTLVKRGRDERTSKPTKVYGQIRK
jgi:hypothetical protein